MTQGIDTRRVAATHRELPVAADTVVKPGQLLVKDSSGNVSPGRTATGLRGIGRAERFVDNTDGAAGAVFAEVRSDGAYSFANSADTDEITRADIGNDCYVVDDATVAKTDGTESRSVAGKVFDVNELGVWVRFDA